MSKVYFISDTHFGHSNIIRYGRRPFRCVEEMDEALIKNWNRTVKEGDVVYHLGDVAASPPRRPIDRAEGELDASEAYTPLDAVGYLGQLNGQIKIVPGNHDEQLVELGNEGLAARFGARVQLLPPLVEVRGVASKTLVLCHYALESWHHSSTVFHLHGHTHPTFHINGEVEISRGLKPMKNRFNMCMCGLFYADSAKGYKPLTFKQILERYEKRMENLNV